ncbi:MAG: glycosyltransferase family 2 protein [Thermodesulfobacteriota bacterium]|nr:glycosyltransferase family 2 protein [Thermodesulfobacteriota bacterium]
MEQIKKPNWRLMLTGIPVLVIILTLLYLMARTVMFFAMDYAWFEKVVAAALLLAEGFLLLHGVGYFTEIFHVIGRLGNVMPADTADSAAPVFFPPVAIVVASYKEPLEIIAETLVSFYNLAYPNKHLVLLDDTRYDLAGRDSEGMDRYRQAVEDLCQRSGVNLFRRQWHHAKAGMINDFLDFLAGRERDGSHFYPYADRPFNRNCTYMAIFDADQNPFPGFLTGLVAQMEANPALGFIQTPQYYSNFEHNRVARAAGLQQAVFYEYICEGKSINDAMFCCGTNALFRISALEDVGGFEEGSVTEDFATSIKFHLKGWHSAYSSTVAAFGLGPEDLGGYFKQQFRWALGTVGMLPLVAREFVRNPFRLPFVKWWEYFLSSTYYMVGFVFFIMMLCPVAYLLFNLPSYFAWPGMYLLFFLPYIGATLWVFLWTLRQRNYRLRDLALGQALIINTFAVYIKASVLALLNRKGTFEVTPKGAANALPLRQLWPNMLFFTISFGALVWGANRLIYRDGAVYALVANMFWCAYHAVVLGAVLYINRAKEVEKPA